MSTQRPSGSPGGARAPGFHVRDPTALWMRIGYLAVIAFATIAEPASADRLLVDERLRQALRPELTGRDIVDAARNILSSPAGARSGSSPRRAVGRCPCSCARP